MNKRSCVFLDRDGVINVKPAPGQYIRNWGEFQFLPGIVDWIRLFNALGVLVIVVTNQRGVALGMIAEADLAAIHRNMVAELASLGAVVDDVFCCPHEEDECECRKPKPGLILKAAQKWEVDLAQSVFIGDNESDQQLASNCGIPFLGAANGRLLPSGAKLS
jgi:D-glycero-D-manno-heptose 1,7-bisphosphate phosphatase